jgi:hypothetical protein
MPDVKGRYFHVEALVDNQALHDLLLGLDQLEVYNVQVRAVRPETLSKPARRVAMPMPDQAPALPHKGPGGDMRSPQARARTLTALISKFLNEHPPGAGVTLDAMRERLGGAKQWQPNHLHQVLHYMVKQGQLVRLGMGVYARPQP